ncbi:MULTISPECIES: hypothetical protein [unclassified Sinorhizobium]|uniref:hypothetical protein n=1 Tax=unclassified Sinorhizobium TaxID=2613772 RepID=UPI0035240581
MGKWYMRALAGLVSAVAIHVPCSARAAGWHVAKASSGFGLASLDDAELSRRLTGTIPISDLELCSERIGPAPIIQFDRSAFERSITLGHDPEKLDQAFGAIAAANIRFADNRPLVLLKHFHSTRNADGQQEAEKQ